MFNTVHISCTEKRVVACMILGVVLLRGRPEGIADFFGRIAGEHKTELRVFTEDISPFQEWLLTGWNEFVFMFCGKSFDEHNRWLGMAINKSVHIKFCVCVLAASNFECNRLLGKRQRCSAEDQWRIKDFVPNLRLLPCFWLIWQGKGNWTALCEDGYKRL